MGTRALNIRNVPVRILRGQINYPTVVEDSGGGGMRIKFLPGATVANWNSGLAPSGKAGATLVVMSFPRPGCCMGVNINTTNLTVGAQIQVRAYQSINSSEVEIFNQVFTRGNDTPGLAVLNGEIMMNTSGIRIELYSTTTSDNGKSLGYEWAVKY